MECTFDNDPDRDTDPHTVTIEIEHILENILTKGL